MRFVLVWVGSIILIFSSTCLYAVNHNDDVLMPGSTIVAGNLNDNEFYILGSADKRDPLLNQAAHSFHSKKIVQSTPAHDPYKATKIFVPRIIHTKLKRRKPKTHHAIAKPKSVKMIKLVKHAKVKKLKRKVIRTAAKLNKKVIKTRVAHREVKKKKLRV